jgi:hypothetical protein
MLRARGRQAYNEYMKFYMRKYRAIGHPKISITGIGVIK